MILKLILLLLYSASVFAVQKCEKDLLKTSFRNGNIDLNVLLIWYPVESGLLHTMQLCSNETGLPMQRYCSYDRSSAIGKWNEIPRNTKFLNCSNVDSTCKEEQFEHNYIMKNGVVKKFTNTWKSVKIQEIAVLQEPCLRDTGLPVTRKCLYNPTEYHAEWEPIGENLNNTSCLRETVQELVTYNLNTLYNDVKEDKKENKVKGKKVADKMTELLTTPETVRLPADIKLSSDILKIITENDTKENLVTEVLNITSIIMGTESKIMAKSEELNATSTFLHTINKYFNNIAKRLVPTENCKNITDGVSYTQSEGLTVFFINPSCSNISGVAVYNSFNLRHHRHHQYDEHTNRYYRFLYLNQSLEQLFNEPHLRLATYFPLSLWENLKSKTAGVNSETVLKIMVFRNDTLFANQTKMELQPSKRERILEISIPGYSGDLPEDLPFIFSYKSFYKNLQDNPNCGYWNYNTWVTAGVRTDYRQSNNRNFLLCHSSHLTPFTALLGIKFRPQFTITDDIILKILSDSMLDYISITGCGLSLFGLICIWLTAIIFKSWRIEASNKVLLNMCLVLTIIMMFFLFLNMPDDIRGVVIDMQYSMHCLVIGAFLQYTILVLFTWMLIIAIMQYQRYVQIFGVNRPNKFVTKYAIMAWGMPLIPTCLVAYLDPGSYMPNLDEIRNNTAICYPSGNSLYYGVILPVGVIMLANLALFIYIFISLHRSLNKFKRKRDRENLITQVRLSVLLFFLLGISWIFGILAHLDYSPVCSYIFCLSSTLQGFVLFVYSIVIDESTRYSWITCCCAKNYYTRERY